MSKVRKTKNRRKRTVKLGAEYAVNEYLRVNPNQRVMIITDRVSQRFAKAIYNESRRITDDLHVSVIEEECTGKRRKFPKKFIDFFKDQDKKVISFYLSGFNSPDYEEKFELFRLGDPVANLIDKDSPNHVKHVCLCGIEKEVMKQGMCVPTNLIRYYGGIVYNRLRNSSKINIFSKAGTDLEVDVDSKNVGWRKETNIDYGCWENLPLGEVYTSPVNSNGVLVVDKLVGGHEKTYSFDFLNRYPITLEIEKNKVKKIYCRRATKLVNFLEEEIFEMDSKSNQVGEIGFGIHFGIPHMIGNLLQDEKFPGVHIGIGASMPDCGEQWRSYTHIDMIMSEPSVYVNGNPLIIHGKYVFRKSRR